jgi:hypothetical protein
MKKFNMPVLSAYFTALIIINFANAFGQATVHGYVRDMTGQPIANATVKLVTLNQTRVTSDSGYYDFAQADPVHPFDAAANRSFTLTSKAGRLFLGLDRQANIVVSFFDLSGKLLQTLDARHYPAGDNAIDVPAACCNKTVIAKVTAAAGGSSCFKFTMAQKTIAGLGETSPSASQNGLSKSRAPLAVDSICVTHANYWGGLDFINTRKIKADTGLNNFRMFSNDTSATGWFASTMNFVFTPTATGVTYYQQTVPNYQYCERETQREIEQVFYRTPSEVPSTLRWATYTVNINANDNSGVANTILNGNVMDFAPSYINGQPWWEIEGVHHHEMSHSYQQFYSTPGSSNMGESGPDYARCITGFFYWPQGSKCSGGFDQAYQGGARYWLFIEEKHPGFFYKLMSGPNTGDISTRVQTITGEALSSMCTECEQKGLPYTLGRGSF